MLIRNRKNSAKIVIKCSIAIIILMNITLSAGTPHKSAALPGDEVLVAKFNGRITDVRIPDTEVTLIPIGPDPRWALSIEITKLLEGKLPEIFQKQIAFMIHSPSLFFRGNLGDLPLEYIQYPKGEFLFTFTRRELADNRYYHELTMERIHKEINISPVPFNNLNEASSFISDCLDTDDYIKLASACIGPHHKNNSIINQEVVFEILHFFHLQLSVQSYFKDYTFPSRSNSMELSCHVPDYGDVVIYFIRKQDPWYLRDIVRK